MTCFADRIAVIALALLNLPSIAVAAAEPALPPANPLTFEYTEGQTAPRREIRDPCIVREGDRYYLIVEATSVQLPGAGILPSEGEGHDNGTSHVADFVPPRSVRRRMSGLQHGH